MLKVPYKILFPLIILFCLVGAYSVRSSSVDIIIMLIFGVFGYLLKKYEYEPAPLILALVLGPMLESNLRQALILSHGGFSIFIERPISLICLLVACIFLFLPLIPTFRTVKSKIREEEV